MAELGSVPGNPLFWIDFDGARGHVETLVELAHDEPDERPPCVILVGQSGMGKTSILREAQRRINADFPEPDDWEDARYTPMLRTVIPSSSTSLKINLTLLWKLGWPITTNVHRIADLKVIDLLRKQKTRLVAIDNVHAILTASGKARRDSLDAFRFLMSEGNVPMVIAGLDIAADIFSEDPELRSRSIVLRLDPWPAGEPSQRLILDLARGMKLREPERLAEPEIGAFLWQKSKGVTGNFKRLLHLALKIARRENRERVEFEDLRSAAALLPFDPNA
jgi:Bacterial TniB protein